MNQNFPHTPSVVTIGTFDGVHLGHQKILQHLTAKAAQMELTPVVLTFFPHPRMVIQTTEPIFLLQSISQREQMLKNFGVKNVIIQPFNKAFSELSAEEYVREILCKKLHAKRIIIGYDHRFGHNRQANITDLKHFGNLYGFEVEEIPAQMIDQTSISSTKIRRALQNGAITQANEYLGYHYSLTGEVIHGLKLGRSIGFPTANIRIKESYKLIPKKGVYAVYSFINEQKVFGMMNIGANPTIAGKGQSIEVYFFDFQGNLYTKELTIYLEHYLREEEKFDNLAALKNKIKHDEQSIRSYFGL